MKLAVARFTLVALIAAVVGVAVALIVYVALVAGVIFLILAATGGALAYQQKRRLASAANSAPRRIDRP
jgi:hypothetical protein